jgi:hypothetical protein
MKWLHDFRIVAGVGFIMAMKEIISSISIGMHLHSFNSIVLATAYMVICIEWFVKHEDKLSVFEDFIIPLVLVIAGYAFFDRSKFLLVISIFAFLRLFLTMRKARDGQIIIKAAKGAFILLPVLLFVLHQLNMNVPIIYLAGYSLIACIAAFCAVISFRKKDY